MRKLFLRDEKGFTLIELLIVIAIIAILASIAIPQYMKYQRKAKVSSYALPIARACLMDIAAYCVENPGTDAAVFAVPDTNQPPVFKNCVDNQQTPGGQQVVLKGTNFVCDATGSLSSGTVTGQLGTLTDYTAVCTATLGGFKCTVQ